MSTPRPVLVDRPLPAGGLAAQADLVRDAALAVPGVVGLHGGAFGEVAVHLAGRRVHGVRLRDDRTQVHVVVAHGHPVRASALAVQRAVAAVRPGPVDVTVEDVADPRDVLEHDRVPPEVP